HLPTEHALLDDDGDGQGTLEPDVTGGEGDGRLAATLSLAPIPTADAPGDSTLEALRAEQARLEAELAELRARQESMTETEYEAELERLLLEIARNGRAIREAGG
ncbi:MAG: hypothetical protein R3314_14005, partial [Longimicrobiales bacterium]|nr:hypothetical protein [Longimicrobiales bacterium]